MTKIVMLKTKKRDENQEFQEIDHNEDLTNQQKEALSHRFRLLCCNQKTVIVGINRVRISHTKVIPSFVYYCDQCRKIELRACIEKIELFNEENASIAHKTYKTQIIKFVPKPIEIDPELEEKPKAKRSFISRFFTKK